MSQVLSIDKGNYDIGEDLSEIELNSPTHSTKSVTVDRYGFLSSDKFHEALHQSVKVMNIRKNKETKRERKWMIMLSKWNKFYDVEKECSRRKLKARIRKGIPDPFRGKVWCLLVDTCEIKTRLANLRKINAPPLSPKIIDEIERDIQRTFSQHTMFAEKNGEGQNALRKILQYYATLDSEVGYCQGMGFIAGLFLTYMLEEDAFHCFYAALMNNKQHLRSLFLPNLPETRKILYIFECLGDQHLGDLWIHLTEQGLQPSMYFTEWLMTMFCRGFSFDLVTRVWDIFLAEGSLKIVYRVSLAILKYFESVLMTYQFEKIIGLVNEMHRHIDAEKLMELVWTIPLRTEHIQFHEQVYNDHMEKEARNAKSARPHSENIYL